MNNFLIIPDSFKGTLSASAVCDAIETGILNILPDPKIKKIPAADGGEGTVDALLNALGGEKIHLTVSDPYRRPIEGFYGILPNGTAVIEMAAAAGLPLLKKEELDPKKTTTYGVGELLDDAIKRGCTDILLGLGGSCTNDFGCGAAAAMGAVFKDASGNAFLPTGGTLSDIKDYDLTKIKERLCGINITVICDIKNAAYGKKGAAYVFAPQKGADENAVKELDDNLRALGNLILEKEQIDVQQIKGGGAAGAMGAGMTVFFGAKLISGIDAILDAVDFEKIAPEYDIIFTGEGMFDLQSLDGKVCIGVAKRAKALGIPVIVIAGGIGDHMELAYSLGVRAMFSINRLPMPLSLSAPFTEDNLIAVTENIIHTLTIQ